MLMRRAYYEVTVAGGNNITEFGGIVLCRLKTCSNTIRIACAFRSYLLVNFGFLRLRRRPPGGRVLVGATRRRRVGDNRWASLYGFARLRRPTVVAIEGYRMLPILKR